MRDPNSGQVARTGGRSSRQQLAGGSRLAHRRDTCFDSRSHRLIASDNSHQTWTVLLACSALIIIVTDI
jgi:hypothetical protein